MIHRVKEVAAKPDYILEAMFYNGEVVQYDVKQLFSIFPQFNILKKDPSLFSKVSVDQGGYGVSWNDVLDLEAETIWKKGTIVEISGKKDLNHLIAYQLLMAREKSHMTQKELSEKTGIYQADISKLERGIANPSIGTLKRIADGLDMDLRIDFVSRE